MAACDSTLSAGRHEGYSSRQIAGAHARRSRRQGHYRAISQYYAYAACEHLLLSLFVWCSFADFFRTWLLFFTGPRLQNTLEGYGKTWSSFCKLTTSWTSKLLTFLKGDSRARGERGNVLPETGFSTVQRRKLNLFLPGVCFLETCLVWPALL